MKFQVGHPPIPGCETGGRPRFWTDEKIEYEADLLIEWAQKDGSLVMAKHYGSRGYTYEHVSDWCKKNETFLEAKKMAMMIVGARREEMALLGSIDSKMVQKSMGLYNPEYKQYELELKSADIKAHQNQSTEVLERIIESVESKKNLIKKNEGDL